MCDRLNSFAKMKCTDTSRCVHVVTFIYSAYTVFRLESKYNRKIFQILEVSSKDVEEYALYNKNVHLASVHTLSLRVTEICAN